MKGTSKLKSNDDIASEWNEIAEGRFRQLIGNKDISMDNIIIPMLNDMLNDANLSNVIDFGCGTGYITNKLRKKPIKFTGIDISVNCIDIARKNFTKDSKTDFLVCSIEELPSLKRRKYSAGICNMTLMDVANLDDVISAIQSVLLKNSVLAITLTHPYFWPLYWNYNNTEWFDYEKEIEVSNTFKISASVSQFETTHYHRPLEMYINTLVKNNFIVEAIFEPMPNAKVKKLYTSEWKFPRFLGIKCRKK